MRSSARAFYRERIGRPTGPVELGRLPTLEKATMMEHFDELVTDPRLRRDELLAHVEALTGDALHLGRYRAMTTSGSSGRKGLFVYDRPAWRGADRHSSCATARWSASARGCRAGCAWPRSAAPRDRT